MKIKANIKTEVLRSKVSYKGTLRVKVEGAETETEFSFATQNPNDDNCHIQISRDDKMLLNLNGPFTKEKLSALEESQLLLLQLFMEPIETGIATAQGGYPEGMEDMKPMLKAFGGNFSASCEFSVGINIPAPEDEKVLRLLN